MSDPSRPGSGARRPGRQDRASGASVAAPQVIPVRPAEGIRPWAAALVHVARFAVVAHAALLPISIAGMQVSLALALAALVVARAGGVRSWVRGDIDVPVLLLTAAGAASVAIAWTVAGIRPASLFDATLWRSFPSPLVVAAACEARLPGEPDGARRRALACVMAWAMACLVVGAVSVAQPWTGFDPLYTVGVRGDPMPNLANQADWPGHFRATGFMTGYIVESLLVIPPLGLVAGLAALAPLRRSRRAVLAAAGVAGAAAALLTLARTAWGSLLAIVGAIVLLERRRRKLLVAIAAVVAAVALALPGVRYRLTRGLSMEINGDRILIWHVCGDVLRDHAWTGVGLGNFGHVSQPYFDRRAPWFPVRTACHDATLTFLVEGGPLLLAAGIAYWVLLARAFLRARRQRDAFGRAAAGAALTALAGAFANSVFHDPFHVTAVVYAMGFAIGTGWVLARPRAEADAGAPYSQR
jgi:O-Antigen ligase